MLKEDWFAVPDGEIYPQMFAKGTVLNGNMLARAKALGLVDELPARAAPQNKAAKKAPETK